MKSSLFLDDFFPSKDLLDDINILRSFDKDQLSKLGNWIIDSDPVTNDLTTLESLISISEVIVAEPDKIRSAFSVSQYILMNSDEETDTPKGIVEDLIEMDAIDKGDDKKMLDYFEIIFPLVDEFTIAQRSAAFQQASLPSIQAISSVVDLRAIIAQRFDLETDIEDYDPKLDSFLPTAIIKLKLTLDEEEELIKFQASPSSLEKFINHLLAIQKELRLLEKAIDKIDTSTLFE